MPEKKIVLPSANADDTRARGTANPRLNFVLLVLVFCCLRLVFYCLLRVPFVFSLFVACCLH
jgi:hypothetical protein